MRPTSASRPPTWPSIRSPSIVCRCITAHSSSSSGPGLLRISLGTEIFPMSWRSAPNSTRRVVLPERLVGLTLARGAGRRIGYQPLVLRDLWLSGVPLHGAEYRLLARPTARRCRVRRRVGERGVEDGGLSVGRFRVAAVAEAGRRAWSHGCDAGQP